MNGTGQLDFLHVLLPPTRAAHERRVLEMRQCACWGAGASAVLPLIQTDVRRLPPDPDDALDRRRCFPFDARHWQMKIDGEAHYRRSQDKYNAGVRVHNAGVQLHNARARYHAGRKRKSDAAEG